MKKKSNSQRDNIHNCTISCIQISKKKIPDLGQMGRREVQIILPRKYKRIIDVKIRCHQLSAIQIKRIELRGRKSLGVKKVASLIQQIGKNQQRLNGVWRWLADEARQRRK